MQKKTNSRVKLSKDKVKCCSVKNCNSKIEAGKEVVLDGKPYCPVCGTILMKEIFGL